MISKFFKKLDYVVDISRAISVIPSLEKDLIVLKGFDIAIDFLDLSLSDRYVIVVVLCVRHFLIVVD